MKLSDRAMRGPVRALVVLLATGLCGCTTYFGSGRREAVQQREDFLLLQEDLRKLSGRVEGAEMQVDQLRGRIDDTSRQQASHSDAQLAALSARVDELERKLGALDAARQKDRQEIIDTLSKKVADVMQQNAAAAARRTTARSGSEYGVEHVVKAGETLSTIAAAYGVKQSAVIEANHLDRPDLLRVGQVLFIPDR